MNVELVRDGGRDPEFEAIFSIGRSIRYHDHRVAWFDRLHRMSSAVSILLAGVIFMEIGGARSPWYIQALAAIGALLSTFDLVLGFAKCADVHRDLKRRFVELEIALVNGASTQEIEVSRRRIEIDEPPLYSALDVLCREEMCAAMGCENQYQPLAWLPRTTRNWYRWPNIAARMKLESHKH